MTVSFGYNSNGSLNGDDDIDVGNDSDNNRDVDHDIDDDRDGGYVFNDN